MKPEDQIKALSELDEALFVIHKPIYDPFGYYRKDACGYTTLSEAWRVTEEVGLKYIGGRPTDHDRVILEPAPDKDYFGSYDPIIKLLQKQPFARQVNIASELCYEGFQSGWTNHDAVNLMCDATPSQLCEALLRVMGKWRNEP